MKNSGLLLAGAAAFLLLRRNGVSAVSTTQNSANPGGNDTLLGSSWADWILQAPDATLALNRGTDVLQIQQGLDLTNPVWQAPTDAPGTVNLNPIAVRSDLINAQIHKYWDVLYDFSHTPELHQQYVSYQQGDSSYRDAYAASRGFTADVIQKIMSGVIVPGLV